MKYIIIRVIANNTETEIMFFGKKVSILSVRGNLKIGDIGAIFRPDINFQQDSVLIDGFLMNEIGEYRRIVLEMQSTWN